MVMNIGIRESASVTTRKITRIVCATAPSIPVFLTFIFAPILAVVSIFSPSFTNYPIAF